jgi:hypothetical protein
MKSILQPLLSASKDNVKALFSLNTNQVYQSPGIEEKV